MGTRGMFYFLANDCLFRGVAVRDWICRPAPCGTPPLNGLPCRMLAHQQLHRRRCRSLLQGTVFETMHAEKVELDFGLLEDKFTTEKKKSAGGGGAAKAEPKKPKKVQLLDNKRSNNVGIVLRNFRLPPVKIRDAVRRRGLLSGCYCWVVVGLRCPGDCDVAAMALGAGSHPPTLTPMLVAAVSSTPRRQVMDLDPGVLTLDATIKLMGALPTPDERDMLLSYDGDPALLGDSEKFLLGPPFGLFVLWLLFFFYFTERAVWGGVGGRGLLT